MDTKQVVSHANVDAAGDPGLRRLPNSSSVYVVAAAGATSREQLEVEVAELRKRAGVADGVELHHTKLRRGLAATVYRELATVPFVASVAIARKVEHAGRWRRPADLVVEVAALAVLDLLQQHGSADLTVVLDAQRAEVAVARMLRKEITDRLRRGDSRHVPCRVVRHDSARTPGLEIADLVAGAAFRWAERGHDDDWVAISPRCRLIQL